MIRIIKELFKFRKNSIRALHILQNFIHGIMLKILRHRENDTADDAKILIVYKISDVKSDTSKIKPVYINNENCLRNAVEHFPPDNHEWIVVADNVCDKTYQMIQKYVSKEHIYRVSFRCVAGTHRFAFNKALEYDDTTIVYFIENDYLHRQGSSGILREGFKLAEAEYVSLYDHPDKYGYADDVNMFVIGGEKTKVFLTESCHWKITNSTPMTFAAQVKTLKHDKKFHYRWMGRLSTDSFKMFTDLRLKGRRLISPMPSYSTHGDFIALAKLIDWETVSR